jgi:hypothetical protein
MPEINPTQETYLAVIGEWSRPSRGGGLVGKAYPFYRIGSDGIVSDPLVEFRDEGSVFLPSRGVARGWDLVRVEPRQSREYSPGKARYICYQEDMRTFEESADNSGFAILLDVPDFDPSGNTLPYPAHDVTPLFFVRKAGKVYGPLRKLSTNRTSLDQLESIQWEPHGDDSLLYEFTEEQLLGQGLRLRSYEFPDGYSRDVVYSAYHVLSGDVHSVKGGTPHDRLTDGRLAEWYLRFARVSLPEEAIKPLRGAFEGLASAPSALIRQRGTRLGELLGRLDILASVRSEVARQFLVSESGRKQVDQEVRKEILRRSAELETEVKQRNEKLAAEKGRINEEWTRLQKEHQVRRLKLEEELSTLSNSEKQLQQSVGALEEQLRQGMDRLATQLSESLPLLAVVTAGFRGTTGSAALAPAQPAAASSSSKRWHEVGPLKLAYPVALVPSEEDLLDNLETALARERLHFTRDFLANLYISLKASPLNLLMGPPGYGKSSVVAGLGRGLGHGDALLEIAVRRVWSDDRYLLGFWDTFHGRYEPGPTGLATRLLQAQRDWEGNREAICLVLLDEFNLAAPEYYFAQLLQAVTRPPDQFHRLRLFDPSSVRTESAEPLSELEIHPNVRFWGTINYDETTERLSPRVLDRTGMIFLNARDVLESTSSDSPPAEPAAGQAVGARQLFEQFTRPREECPDRLWDLLAPFLDMLKRPTEDWGPGIDISPRVLNSVERYLANVGNLLSDARAVDFAFQQRVLPVLHGRGDLFRRRLEALAKELGKQGLERSATHISAALSFADINLGDVDLLAYF